MLILCAFLFVKLWSSFVEGDEGLYLPKLQASFVYEVPKNMVHLHFHWLNSFAMFWASFTDKNLVAIATSKKLLSRFYSTRLLMTFTDSTCHGFTKGSYLDIAIATFLSIWSTKDFVSEFRAKLLIFSWPHGCKTFLSLKVGWHEKYRQCICVKIWAETSLCLPLAVVLIIKGIETF